MKRRLERKRWKNELRQDMLNLFVDDDPFTKKEIMKMSVNEMLYHLHEDWLDQTGYRGFIWHN